MAAGNCPADNFSVCLGCNGSRNYCSITFTIPGRCDNDDFYYFIMFAPFASVIGEFMHWSIERLIFIAWLAQVVFTPLIALPTDLVDNHFLLLALSTGAVGAVAFFILTTTVMRTWHLSWPELKPHWSGDFNWGYLLD